MNARHYFKQSNLAHQISYYNTGKKSLYILPFNITIVRDIRIELKIVRFLSQFVRRGWV